MLIRFHFNLDRKRKIHGKPKKNLKYHDLEGFLALFSNMVVYQELKHERIETNEAVEVEGNVRRSSITTPQEIRIKQGVYDCNGGFFYLRGSNIHARETQNSRIDALQGITIEGLVSGGELSAKLDDIVVGKVAPKTVFVLGYTSKEQEDIRRAYAQADEMYNALNQQFTSLTQRTNAKDRAVKNFLIAQEAQTSEQIRALRARNKPLRNAMDELAQSWESQECLNTEIKKSGSVKENAWEAWKKTRLTRNKLRVQRSIDADVEITINGITYRTEKPIYTEANKELVFYRDPSTGVIIWEMMKKES